MSDRKTYPHAPSTKDYIFDDEEFDIRTPEQRCSFCGNGKRDAKHVIVQNNICICAVCVVVCTFIIEKRDAFGGDEESPHQHPHQSELRCSFCGIDEPNATLLIVQDDACICDACVNELKTPELITPKICLLALHYFDWGLVPVPNKLKTLELCLAAVLNCGWALKYVPEELKTRYGR